MGNRWNLLLKIVINSETHCIFRLSLLTWILLQTAAKGDPAILSRIIWSASAKQASFAWFISDFWNSLQVLTTSLEEEDEEFPRLITIIRGSSVVLLSEYSVFVLSVVASVVLKINLVVGHFHIVLNRAWVTPRQWSFHFIIMNPRVEIDRRFRWKTGVDGRAVGSSHVKSSVQSTPGTIDSKV